MDVPEGLYTEHLRLASHRVAAFADPDFESVGVNTGEDRPGEDAQALDLTAVYLLPDQPQPRLRKARFRDPSDVEEGKVDALVDHFTAESRSETSSLGHDEVRSTAEMMAGAADEVAEAASILLPLKVVAVSAIYKVGVNTIYRYNFSASDFLDALVKRFPGIPDEPNDDVLKNMHTRESEFVENPEPLEAWLPHVRKVVVGGGEEKVRAAVFSSVQLLLLPAEATDPIISRRLFEEAAT